MPKEFMLGEMKVTVKDITVGDLKEIQRRNKDADELDQVGIMICVCTGISMESFDMIPIRSVKDIEQIADYISSVIEPK